MFNNGSSEFPEVSGELRLLYDRLKKEIGREPTATDLDKCVYTPSSRLLQRYFKEGVVGFRKFIGLAITDLGKGDYRSKKMSEIFSNSKKYEMDLFMKLYNKLNSDKVLVIREYCYQQWFDESRQHFFHGNFSDVAIIEGDHVQLFDFTCPSNVNNLASCVRIKIKKLEKQPIAFRPEVTYEVCFVCVNPEITQSQIDNVPICNKSIKVYSLEAFKAKFL